MPGYDYTLLSAAADSGHGTFNIYAVVAECSVPRPTRGTDMVCNLTLVDPSTPDRADLAAGIEMLCFAATPQELPHIRRPGDIIRLHRVKLNRYNDKPQLVGKIGFRGAGFAFCLFDSAGGDADEGPAAAAAGGQPPLAAPYQTSSPHYHFDAREQGLLSALRHYYATMNRQQLGGNTTYLRRLKDVRPRQFFDAVCRVVAVDDSDPRLRLLYIWDASDALPFPMAYDTRDAEGAPEALQLLQQLRPFALPLADTPEGRLREVPLLGSAVPLLFPKSRRVEQPALGSWVKMRNLGARVVSGQLQAYFHRSSRWTPWQQEEAPQQLQEEYQQRLAANHVAGWAPAGADELLALTSRRDQPYSTLRQVLLDTPAAQPRCYRVLVRLMEFTPAQPADMCHPASACGLPGNGRWVYTLKLLVEDATAQLDVILFGPDGDCFFSGLPARDMGADPQAAAALLQELHRLLGAGCQRDGGPWMELSIKTYYSDPARPWHTRQYRVHATSLQPEQPPATEAEAEPPARAVAAGGEGAAAAVGAAAAAVGS